MSSNTLDASPPLKDKNFSPDNPNRIRVHCVITFEDRESDLEFTGRTDMYFYNSLPENGKEIQWDLGTPGNTTAEDLKNGGFSGTVVVRDKMWLAGRSSRGVEGSKEIAVCTPTLLLTVKSLLNFNSTFPDVLR